MNSAPTILDQHGHPMRAGVRSPAHSGADRFSQELATWQPALESADSEWLDDRDTVVARVQDIARNDGWASSALRTKLVGVLGPKLNLQARPDYRHLGQDHEWFSNWSRSTEASFRNYAEDPDYHADVREMQTLSGLIQTAFLDLMQSGEALALAYWKPRAAAQYATRFRVISPDRLSTPPHLRYDENISGGVEKDKDGRPIAYHIRKSHPGSRLSLYQNNSWDRIKRKTKFGRLKVIHFFAHGRSEQSRGKSLFTPIIEKLKMVSKLNRYQLQMALLNSVMGAYIESPVDQNFLTEVISNAGGGLGEFQDARKAFHDSRAILMDGVQIPTLFPGEEVKFVSATHPSSGHAEFEQAFLRNISAGIGVSYEQLSQDWSKTNYSSARASLLEAWKIMVFDREGFAQNFIRHMYVLWLEEAIDKQTVLLPPGAPGFYAAKAAYSNCRVLGPPRGWIDPLKEAQAAAARQAAGITTLEQECAEQGLDYEEVMDQQALENRKRSELGLVQSNLANGDTAKAGQKEDREEDQGEEQEDDPKVTGSGIPITGSASHHFSAAQA